MKRMRGMQIWRCGGCDRGAEGERTDNWQGGKEGKLAATVSQP